eukprot:6946450-Prymnesium_polylepis.1
MIQRLRLTTPMRQARLLRFCAIRSRSSALKNSCHARRHASASWWPVCGDLCARSSGSPSPHDRDTSYAARCASSDSTRHAVPMRLNLASASGSEHLSGLWRSEWRVTSVAQQTVKEDLNTSAAHCQRSACCLYA